MGHDFHSFSVREQNRSVALDFATHPGKVAGITLSSFCPLHASHGIAVVSKGLRSESKFQPLTLDRVWLFPLPWPGMERGRGACEERRGFPFCLGFYSARPQLYTASTCWSHFLTHLRVTRVVTGRLFGSGNRERVGEEVSGQECGGSCHSKSQGHCSCTDSSGSGDTA